ncbi:hypothetical protein CEXT_440661 [Caerostris extrusa]|uniref:Uncharacterized protein n=1 Tax=Caerostris extrusa TaxID=172846 RepID=A0AAV4RCB8_CAEEX|nr:hypothetical protein CEXT_440661 [Caerostris extrusa]
MRRKSKRERERRVGGPVNTLSDRGGASRILPPPPMKADNGEQGKRACLHNPVQTTPGKGAETEAAGIKIGVKGLMKRN